MMTREAVEQTTMRGAAFFDVDETIIAMKSMQSFLDFFFEKTKQYTVSPWQDFLRTVERLPRAEGNREYYKLWSGQRIDDLISAGVVWFGQHREDPGFFIPGTLDALRKHHQSGHQVILISGSFHPCIDPIAAHIGVDVTYCTELEEVDGLLTGEVIQSRIGEGKRYLVQKFIEQHKVPLRDTWAYGDHISDLPMLTAVGNPVAVEGDPELLYIARSRRWDVIPSPIYRPVREKSDKS